MLFWFEFESSSSCLSSCHTILCLWPSNQSICRLKATSFFEVRKSLPLSSFTSAKISLAWSTFCPIERNRISRRQTTHLLSFNGQKFFTPTLSDWFISGANLVSRHVLNSLGRDGISIEEGLWLNEIWDVLCGCALQLYALWTHRHTKDCCFKAAPARLRDSGV